jgi:GNAT superfamily N-acetyltransferase
MVPLPTRVESREVSLRSDPRRLQQIVDGTAVAGRSRVHGDVAFDCLTATGALCFVEAMSAFSVTELEIPTEVGAPGWDDFVEMTEMRNAIETGAIGSRELAFDAVELLPRWRDPNDPRRVFVTRVDGRIVGRVTYEFSHDDTVAWLTAEVLEGFRGRGIGSALYDRAFAVATDDGKMIFQTEFYSGLDDSGARIRSPSGFGSVPADTVESRFAVSRGYGLQLVLRYSRLGLPVDAGVVDDYRRAAATAAGPDYRVVRWEGRTPEKWLTYSGVLRARMYTDAPHGDLDMGEEVWDAQRVRELDEVDERSGRSMLIAAIEHIPSGELVAFSELAVPPQVERPVSQRDTLVLKEHRGHRLGMLLKADNLATLSANHPGHPSITTTNAEENRYMFAVNDAVGFEAIARSGVWKYVPAGTTDKSAILGS